LLILNGFGKVLFVWPDFSYWNFLMTVLAAENDVPDGAEEIAEVGAEGGL